MSNTTTYNTISEYVQDMTARATDQAHIIEHAQRQEALGFTGTELSKRAREIGSLFGDPKLHAEYAEKYPGTVFLPWEALHTIRLNLGVSVDLAKNYRGAVPPEQLKAMEQFDFEASKEDSPKFTEFVEKLASKKHVTLFKTILPVLKAVDKLGNDMASQNDVMITFARYEAAIRTAIDDLGTSSMDFAADPTPDQLIEGCGRLLHDLRAEYMSACDSYVMVAPPEAMISGKMDLIWRLVNVISTVGERVGLIKRDPLALKLVRGGALVVAAWGDEADELNRIAQERFRLDV